MKNAYLPPEHFEKNGQQDTRFGKAGLPTTSDLLVPIGSAICS